MTLKLPMGKGLQVCVPRSWIVNIWTKEGVQKWRWYKRRTDLRV